MISTADEHDPDTSQVPVEGKSVVIGLGNPYMRDDGVGIEVARELGRRGLGPEVLVYEYQTLELSLLWQFRGASKIIIVDAMKSGGSIGTVTTHRITPREGPLLDLPSLHSLQLYDMFDLANQSGMLPCPLTIIGVEPSDCNPGEGLTEPVAAAIQRAADTVIHALDGS